MRDDCGEARLSRHLEVYPPGHRNYTPTIPERLTWIRKTTLKDAQRCYHDLVGATGADFAAVGEFDADEVARAVDELFGGWKSPHPFTRVPSSCVTRASTRLSRCAAQAITSCMQIT